jgi:hypothetical protein
VSGCQLGKAPWEALAGICQSLVGAEVPLAVGWAASIADDLATNLFSGLKKAKKLRIEWLSTQTVFSRAIECKKYLTNNLKT